VGAVLTPAFPARSKPVAPTLDTQNRRTVVVDLLDKVNTYYTGQLLFAFLRMTEILSTSVFFDKVDGFYLTLSDQGLKAYIYDQYSVELTWMEQCLLFMRRR
jgi:hypothetical protein